MPGRVQQLHVCIRPGFSMHLKLLLIWKMIYGIELDILMSSYLAWKQSCIKITLWQLLQTGSGKTHTMLGDIDHLSDKPSENRGMTPRVFEYLFSRIRMVCRSSVPAFVITFGTHSIIH